jgi:hypothetical protein
MSSILVPILVAAFIGYQTDDLKMKKYDMTNQEGEVLKIQFSKNGSYSCPLSCSLDHYHYAKLNNDAENNNKKQDWSVGLNLNNDGFNEYEVNGVVMESYAACKTVRKMPKQSMPVSFSND